MTRADRIALLLSILAVFVTYIVTIRVFEAMAHIEDEMAYVWQAQAITRGQLTVPSPPQKQDFLVPFVVDYNGHRFGKYPLGWPVVLSFGILLGLRSWVNPILAGIGVWLTYQLGKRTFSETVGLLAAGLTLISPFFLMNSGSLLSHPLGLVLSAAFVLSWLGAFWKPVFERPWLPTMAAAFSLGLLALTRPLTAVAVAVPFAVHGVYLLVRGNWEVRKRLLTLGATVLVLSSLHLLWQYAVTGDAFLNPYTLWWSYDKIGFGPGIGRNPAGHTLKQAWINTRFSLYVGENDLFGWGRYSWIFLPFGLIAAIRNLRDPERRSIWPVAFVMPALIVVYMAYWIGSSLFGPRYYYEGLYSLTILSGAGIALLAGWPLRSEERWPRYTGWWQARPLLMTAIVALLASASIFFYIPIRVGGMHDLYGIQRSDLAPFLTPEAQELTPALVIVHPKEWTDYGALLELENPFLDTPFIFAFSGGEKSDRRLATYFPNRRVLHYYPVSHPRELFTEPLPD